MASGRGRHNPQEACFQIPCSLLLEPWRVLLVWARSERQLFDFFHQESQKLNSENQTCQNCWGQKIPKRHPGFHAHTGKWTMRGMDGQPLTLQYSREWPRAGGPNTWLCQSLAVWPHAWCLCFSASNCLGYKELAPPRFCMRITGDTALSHWVLYVWCAGRSWQ